MKKLLIFCSIILVVVVAFILGKEKTNPSSSMTKGQVEFDVEHFGREHTALKKDIELLLAESDAVHLINVVKFDEDGIALVDFSPAFIKAFDATMATATAGELLRNLNSRVFSYEEIQTVYYLIDGNSTDWWKWLELAHEPITRDDVMR